MAEDMPEDKYDFKPNPAERSFAEQLLHAAGANYFFINPVKGVEPPKGDPKRADYKTKAAVVEYVRKSFSDGATLIQSKGDSGLGDLMIDPFSKNQARFSDFAWGFIEHSGEHYGHCGLLPRGWTRAPRITAEEVTAIPIDGVAVGRGGGLPHLRRRLH